MTDLQAVADRVEIDALRAEFTDAAMMRDRPRMAALFTIDGVLRMPNVPVEFTGRDEIREGGEKLQAQWDFFVQTTHPGSVELDGDVATGRAYMHEVVRLLDGRQGQNFAVYHDRYRRTADGWRFAERVYEVRYLDPTPLAGFAPGPAGETATGTTGEPNGGLATGTAGGTATGTEPERPSLEKAAAALAANGFGVEILDDAAAARARVAELIPPGAEVFTAASETLRLSGIEEDLNASGRYDALRPVLLAMDRVAHADDHRRLLARPDFVVGSVNAVTETGSLVTASGSGSQLPAYSGGARRAIWVVGAQKVVPDLPAALRRIHEYVLPLESARTQQAYGSPSAVNRLLVMNAEPRPGRVTVLLLRSEIGF
jgi:ketosteroid isomerase-like protein